MSTNTGLAPVRQIAPAVAKKVYGEVMTSSPAPICSDIRETSKGELKEETGQIKWEFELEPSSERTLNLAYDVAWPKDRNINI